MGRGLNRTFAAMWHTIEQAASLAGVTVSTARRRVYKLSDADRARLTKTGQRGRLLLAAELLESWSAATIEAATITDRPATDPPPTDPAGVLREMYDAQIAILRAELAESKAERGRLHDRLRELTHLLAMSEQKQIAHPPPPDPPPGQTSGVLLLLGLVIVLFAVLLALYLTEL